MPDVVDQAKRVLGTVVVLIGAGLIVDCQAWRPGTAIIALGGATLAWGFLHRYLVPTPTVVPDVRATEELR